MYPGNNTGIFSRQDGVRVDADRTTTRGEWSLDRGAFHISGSQAMRETFHAGHFSSGWIRAQRWG